MPLPLAGYNTAGAVNSATVALTEWEVSPEVEDLDGTSTESGGFYVPFAGRVKAEVTLTGFFDALQNPYDAPPDLQPGRLVALEIFLDQNALGVFWNFPAAMVKSAKCSGKITEKVMFTAQLIGSGEFTYPTGDPG